jgi:hypothetical protein
MATIVRTRTTALLTPAQTLPVLLGINTALLITLDQLGAVPSWVKLAAAMFLEF